MRQHRMDPTNIQTGNEEFQYSYASNVLFMFTYQTKNMQTNKSYIGVHCCENLDDGYLGSGTALGASISKYGSSVFQREILSFWDTIEEAYEEEAWLVNEQWVASKDNYNIALGGRGNGGWNKGLEASEKTKSKMSVSHTGIKKGSYNAGKNNSFYGKKHNEETRKKMGRPGKIPWNKGLKFNGVASSASKLQ